MAYPRPAVVRARIAYGAAVAIVVAIAVVGSTMMVRRTASPREELAQLASSLPHRAFRPRLAGDFAYAPVDLRPSSGQGSDGSLRLRSAATAQAQSPNLHLAGISNLFSGQTREAVRLLRAAASSANSDVWSDLAAALLVASEQNDRSLPALDALGAADHALRRDPRHAPAAFNRALALERLGLWDDAMAAWEDYRAIDPYSGWSREADAAMRRLRDQAGSGANWRTTVPALELAIERGDTRTISTLVRRFSRDARAWGESVYTSSWAAAFEAKDEAAVTQALRRARGLGAALETAFGERLLSDAVAVIDRGSPDEKALLAKAYLAYRSGRIAHTKQAAETLAHLREADRLFSLARSPMALVARYYVGSALYGEQRLEETLAVLEPLAEQRYERCGYLALSAQIGWERGLATLSRGGFSEAAAIFNASQALYERLGERSNAAMMMTFHALTLDIPGDAEAAWKSRRFAFQEFARNHDSTFKLQGLGNAATSLIVRREWDRARPLLDIAAATARESKDIPRLCVTLAQRSAVLAAAGDEPAARRDLAELGSRLPEISDAAARAAMLVDAQYAEARLVAERDPAAAVERLTAALDELDRKGRAVFLIRVYLERSRAYRRLGDFAAARADIAGGLETTERNRQAIVDPQLRALAIAGAEELFHEGIDLAIAQREFAEAFRLAEWSRARSLLDSFHAAAGVQRIAPLDLSAIQQALSPRAAIVESVALRDRLVTFVISNDDLQHVTTNIDRDDVHRIARAAAAAAHDEIGNVRALERAWEVLIAPIETLLARFDTVAFAPDRSLAGVPFAALRNVRTGDFLINGWACSVVPSASLAILEAQRAASSGKVSVLSIAATEFDAERYPQAPTLRWAEPEAKAVYAAYPDGRLLTGAAATPEAVADGLRQATVVQYAGHSTAPSHDRAASELLLAKGGARSTLTAGAISRLPLSHVRLVVLTSCRSALSGDVGDGVENLASAFLLAGAASVLGASWDVDDRVAADLAVAFHRHYRASSDIAHAFRAAVLAQPRVEPVPSWAVMTPFGGFPALIRTETKEKRE